jgi:hypothetical protein
MANHPERDPMFIDTAGGPYSTGRTTNIFKTVEWVGPEATEDRAYAVDNLGAVICDFRCDVPGKNQFKHFGGKGQVFEGPFTVSILDSGYLLVARV